MKPDNERRPAGKRSAERSPTKAIERHDSTVVANATTLTFPHAHLLEQIRTDAARVQPAIEMLIDLIDYQSNTRLLSAAAYQCKLAASAYKELSKRLYLEHDLAGKHRRSTQGQLDGLGR